MKLMPQMRLAAEGQSETGSVFRVTKQLSVTSTPVYVVPPASLAGISASAGMRFPVLTLAAGAQGELRLSDYAISNVTASVDANLICLDVATDETTGDATLFLVRKPVVVLQRDTTTTDPNPTGASGTGNYGALSTTNFWSDAQVPHAGTVYNVNGKVCRSRGDVAQDVFGGDLLIVSGGNLVLQSQEIVISNLCFTGNNPCLSNWHANGNKTTNTFARGGTKVLKGTRMVMNPALSHSISSIGGYIRFDIPIEGSGTLNLGMHANQPAGNAYLEFADDNSKWTGVLNISVGTSTNAAYGRQTHTFTNTAEVFFREAKNLGGPRSSFHSGALFLKDKSILHPLQTVTLDEPTRGLQIGGTGAGIRTDDGTVFTVREQLMLQGTLTKFGAGTLALGGRTTFGDASTFTPGDQTYTIDVQEGGLRAVETNAVDGVTFTFGETGALEADPEATGDVASYGLYDVLVDAPFGRAPSGFVPVRLVLPTSYTSAAHPISATICTVNATAAASLGVNAFAVERPPKCRTYVTARTNADGTVTYTANIAPSGMIFTIR